MKTFTLLPLLSLGASAIPTYGFYLTQVNAGPSTLCQLDNGSRLEFQTDGNLVFYSGGNRDVLWSSNKVAPGNNCNGNCKVNFQGDGNLVTYYGGQALFNTGTGGNRGALLVCTQAPPYLTVLNINGDKIWTTGK